MASFVSNKGKALNLNTYKVACRVGKEQQIWHIAAEDFVAAHKSAMADVEACTAAVVLVEPMVQEEEDNEPEAA